jgi:signal transduction histidine kinase
MARRVPIKVKVATALSVPLVLLLAAAALEVGRATREARLVREQTDLATATIGPSGVINAMQNERNFTGMWLLGSQGAIDLPVDSLEEARAATDASIRTFRDEIERKGGRTERAYRSALAALDGEGGIADLRVDVDAYDGPRLLNEYNPTADESFNRYTELIDALADPTTELARTIEDGDLRRGIVLIDLGSRSLDGVARGVRESILHVMQGDGVVDEPEEVRRAALTYDEVARRRERILSLATGPYADIGRELEAESDATGVQERFRRTVETGEVDVGGLLEGVSIDDDQSYYGFIQDVSVVIRDRADDLNAAARDERRLVLAMAGALVLATALAVPLVSRSISRPLLSLAAQARDLATRRLPEAVRRVNETPPGADVGPPPLEPIRVRTRDEVADVALRLNAVQDTAVRLAVEQAALRRNGSEAFVSLARRNQNLLSRQLDYITALEANEADATTLANLFDLDHQATRMRRNAESLLVLGGAPAMRHSATPAPLLNVVRAALGEVDDYSMVRVAGVKPATVDGTVVADLSHLLAELIENALRASHPGVPVEVRGHGGADAYVLGIVDHGRGMTADELAEANARLSRAEGHAMAPSQHLGHYVTAILAARHGITVRLQATPGGGVTAVVRMPTRLLVADTPGSPPGLPPRLVIPRAPLAPAATPASPR